VGAIAWSRKIECQRTNRQGLCGYSFARTVGRNLQHFSPKMMRTTEVMTISDGQATLFDIDRYAIESGEKWGWLDEDPKLGTKESLVPNSPSSKLGTDKSLVPNSPSSKLGTNKISVPNFETMGTWAEKFNGVYLEEWKPIVGCLQQKWVKNQQYWYWRYYDNRGKKRSIYLCKDYSEAVRKVIKMEMPTDAKLPHLPASDPPPTT
jgi:hypothetical protein